MFKYYHLTKHLFCALAVFSTFNAYGASSYDPNKGARIVEKDIQSSFMKGFPPLEDKVVDTHSMDWILNPEKSRWAMQNMSKITHTAAVSRGSQPIVYLPRDECNLLDKKFKDSLNRDFLLKKLLKKIEVDGFIALKDGKILVEAYYNGYGPEQRHEMMSVTKSLVGTLVGVLVGENKLETTKRISDYLPELKKTGWNDATLRQTLDMTTGVRWNENHMDEKSHIIKAATAVGLQHGEKGHPFTNGMAILKSVGKEYEHGQIYDYRSGNSEVLGWLITRILNKNWQDVFSEKIWSKLGAERDALLIVDSSGQGAAHAGFNSSLRDMARFGVMIAQNGYYNGHQIVPRKWIEDIRYGDDAVRDAWRRSNEGNLNRDVIFYRSQFRVVDSNEGILLALGAKGQMIYINISKNLVGVFQSSTTAVGDNNTLLDQLGIMKQISNIYSEFKKF